MTAGSGRYKALRIPSPHLHYEDDPDSCTALCVIGMSRRRQWAAVAMMAIFTVTFAVAAVFSSWETRVAMAALAGVAGASTFWMAYITAGDA